MWETLLTEYSLREIIIGLIILIISMKGSFDFFDWVKLKYKEKFDKDYNQKKKEDLTEEHYQELIEMEKKIDKLTETVNTRMDNIEESIKRLTDSDMHDIKSWIVEKHHRLMEQKWVDDFTMDTIEKRYHDYKIEGGNSYIKGLVDEIRTLPHTPVDKGEE